MKRAIRNSTLIFKTENDAESFRLVGVIREDGDDHRQTGYVSVGVIKLHKNILLGTERLVRKLFYVFLPLFQ